MRIKCTRAIITKEGIVDLIYYFDTETLRLEFDEKDWPLLVKIYNKEACDVHGMTEYEAM